MLLMKKDMGGAANVLGLAPMIMDAKLPVRLRVLIPVVENAISGNAFRPGDVLTSRKGITVEIGNTDAEGRLILADALALADEENPALLIDMATLTGAARVALGPDLPPFYTGDDALAADLAEAGRSVADPLWRMPLWKPYDSKLSSKVADINNVADRRICGLRHRGAFPEALRGEDGELGAFRHFRMEPERAPALSAGRRGAGDPGHRTRAFEIATLCRNAIVFYHSIVDVTEPKQLSEMLWPMAVQMRPSQALRLWQQVALAEVRADVPDLTMRQLAILLVVYLDPPPHTVRGLAEKLNVTKPVITRALDTMGAMKLVSRHRDERDKRNVLVKRTVEGALFVERFGDVIIAKGGELPI